LPSRRIGLALFTLCISLGCRREPPPGDTQSRPWRATPAADAGRPRAAALPQELKAARTEIPDASVEVDKVVPRVDDPELNRVPEFTEAALANRTPLSDGPRFYAKNRHVWIYPEPNISLQWIGFLWTGGSVRLRSTRPIYGEGCTFFYAVLPRGFVCTDGNRGTIDPEDKQYRQLLRYAPRTDSPWLHRYGQVKPLTRYFDFPGAVARAADAGADDATAAALDFHRLPPSIHEAHTSLIDRSTVAYTVEIHRDSQDWLLTSDYALVPKDKVTPYPNSSFHGLVLNDGVKLPLAFFRGSDRPRYAKSMSNHFELAGNPYPRLSFAKLTGQKQHLDDVDWLETADGGWVKASDATVPTPSERTPWGALVGQPDASPNAPKGRAPWIEVSILGGWLLAYEGTHPAFVTLISPGSGGMPRKGQAPIDTFSTPLGRYQINGKFVSSTMIGPTGLIHSEVPYAQNFAELYAIHTAYWHDNWGYPMSGGCVNVSPIDGYYLFHWTEPVIPEGWYGVRWIPSREPSTTVVIHR